MREMYKNMGICDDVYDYCDNIIKSLHDRFEEIDKNAEYNQMKVIKAMQDEKVAEMHLSGTTGYGYNDDGRDTLEKIYSDIFKTEDALVRPQIICGTHALNVALSSNLRPGDELLSVSDLLREALQNMELHTHRLTCCQMVVLIMRVLRMQSMKEQSL